MICGAYNGLINVFDAIGEICFRIHAPSGAALIHGEVWGHDGLLRQRPLNLLRTATGLNGERIEYYEVGHGGDVVRFVETATESWWEVYEPAFDDEQYIELCEDNDGLGKIC